MKAEDLKLNIPNLEKEQADLIALMEASITPEVLVAVEMAYHTDDDDKPSLSLNISYEGASDAKPI